MRWISAIAIVISCMGLFGLVALATVRRTKEIGIRKVLGATTSSVLVLMSREFGWLVVAANVVAWPVAYFALNRCSRSTPIALTWAWGGLCWRAWAFSRLRWLPSAARRGWRRGPIRRMR